MDVDAPRHLVHGYCAGAADRYKTAAEPALRQRGRLSCTVPIEGARKRELLGLSFGVLGDVRAGDACQSQLYQIVDPVST